MYVMNTIMQEDDRFYGSVMAKMANFTACHGLTEILRKTENHFY